MNVELCLPVYNEEKILEASALKLLEFCREKKFNFAWKIIFVFNGSTDNSVKIGKELSLRFPGLFAVFEKKEKGRGLALKEYWLSSRADILVYMDADLAASLDDLEDLINPLLNNESDLAIGSRLLAKSQIDRSIFREIVSQTYNLLSRIILGHKFSDMQCGFKAIKKEAFAKIAPYLSGESWFFDTELIIFAAVFGFRINEVPIKWEEERYDRRKSKVNVVKDGFKFIFDLLALRSRISRIKKEK